MKDPILYECEECGDIALEAAYGGMKCAGCMLDVVDDPVVIDSVGRAIATLLQDVVREHGAMQRPHGSNKDHSLPAKSVKRRTGEELRAANARGCVYGCNCFQCVPSVYEQYAAQQQAMNDGQLQAAAMRQQSQLAAARQQQGLAAQRMSAEQAQAIFQQRHGRSADTAQNIAHQSEPSADEMKELTRFEQNVIDRAVHSVAARAEQVASPTCSKCRAETTHAASCGCGKCYGCCAT